MQANIEEEEKCLEKLTQMQKYLPFLDFMIDKIQKKNCEVSLECQLSKFQLLRSMISEKNGKYTWDAIVKVEEVVEKLISKLDFKEQYENSKEYTDKADSRLHETSMATSVSLVPSSTTNVSVTTAPKTQETSGDGKNQNFSTRAGYLIMKSLKISVDGSMKKCADGGASPLEINQSLDVTSNTMETDLDKDLDGFDLVDCSNLSETATSSTAAEPSAKPPSGDDLLSSSRERLLKSLQSRLFPNKTQSDSSAGNKCEKTSEPVCTSAFSRSQIHLGERKTKSDAIDCSDHRTADKNRKDTSVKSHDKKTTVTPDPLKFVSSIEKTRTDSGNSSSDNLKQRLKEKLSSVIGEVYRVPGKSVGGSLRSLKESRDRRKSLVIEEDDLFKPDKINEREVTRHSNIPQSKSSTETKNQPSKSHRDHSSGQRKEEKVSEKTSHKSHSSSSSKHEKKHDSRNSKVSESYISKIECSRKSKTREKKPDNKSLKEKKFFNAKEEKNFDLEKLNDDELLKFVKENMQSLPHLSKLKPEELRKTIRSSLSSNFLAVDTDAISEISDDSFQDLDDICDDNKKDPKSKNGSETPKSLDKSEEPHFLASFKIAQVGSDGVAKNVKPIVEPSKDTKILEEIGDKTHDIDDALDENRDEEEYALKLIEEITPKLPPKKKKGLLELPMPIADDLFNDISSIESFETSSSPPKKGESRLSVDNKGKPSETRPESGTQVNPELSKTIKDARLSSNGHASKDSNFKSQSNSGSSNVPTDNHKTQHSNQERLDPRLVKPSSHDGSQNPQFSNKHSDELNPISPNPKPPYISDRRRQSHLSSEPKSYAEYKRRKLKEQERIRHKEQKAKESQKSMLPESSKQGPPSLLSLPSIDKEEVFKKIHDSQHSGYRDRKQNNPKTFNAFRSYDARQRRYSDNTEKREKRRNYEGRKEGDKTRHSTDSELVSPLEELYRNEKKPKTGRGYGIQHFKIPKKMKGPLFQKSSNSDGTVRKITNAPSDVNHPKETKEPEIIEVILDLQDEERTDTANIYVKESEKEKTESPVLHSTVETEKERTESTVVSTGESEKEKNEISVVNIVESKENKNKFTLVSETETEKNLEQTDVAQIDSTVSKDVLISSDEGDVVVESAKTDTNVVQINSPNIVVEASREKTDAKDEPVNPVRESANISVETKGTTKSKSSAEIEPKSNDKTDIVQYKNVVEEETVAVAQPRTVVDTLKKCEAEIVECDSSMESSPMNEQSSAKDSTNPSDKSTILSKEEITQEFVEALIRKSFQSGEGKLLLAQVKLFEEFARKLNSKKLKTIQKIINSGSGSSSSRSSSEDEKKKKKSKKSEEKSQKAKKRKKKIKNRRKRKLSFSSSSSPSSSSSESEESSDEESADKKETKSNEKSSICDRTDGEEGKVSQTPSTSEEKSKSSESKVALKSKNKKKRRGLEFGRNFSGNKTKRKRKQKKLLEKILNESPQPETNNESTGEIPSKENEPKNKPRRAKTELDRLHEDIRRMFICEGVVTATGQRMCRILKRSGGNMNNLDIVKESAKMVEEEKLKKVQTRSSSKNSRTSNTGSSESRSSSSQSLENEKTHDSWQENEEDVKLALEPRVALQRVDLDNFGYGVKLSDDCISFRRVQGRNTALRGTGPRRVTTPKRPPLSIPTRTVFLARNRRKFERLRDSKCKKSYIGKKLSDIIEKLPLKMAKMKHLQICEKKNETEVTKKNQNSPKKVSGKTFYPTHLQRSMFNKFELLNYAFEKKRKSYPCKLCSRVTQHITGHYKTSHPEHEVLISRLCLQEARKAKLDSKKNEYYEAAPPQNQLAESMKQKVQALLRRSYKYNCRMCCANKISDINNFASHVCSHTGEYRFQCPVEECTLKTFSLDDMKFHIMTKHAKSKMEFYSKIIELFPLSTDGCQMFGYLCAKCHYVQVCRSNLEKHVTREHEESENVRIIKINMSSKRLRSCQKRSDLPKDNTKNESGNEEVTLDGEEEEEREKGKEKDAEVSVIVETDKKPTEKLFETENVNAKTETVEEKCRKRKPDSSGLGSPTISDVVSPEKKKSHLVEIAKNKEVTKVVTDMKCNENFDDMIEEINVEEEDSQESTLPCDIVMKDSMDLKKISPTKESDVTVSEGGKELTKMRPEVPGVCGKLRVGPLEAKLLGNSEVLYECYIKGCLFTTAAFDLFEIHIKISHWKVRWNGICEICGNEKDDTLKPSTLQLLTALKHLKLHEQEIVTGKKLTSDDFLKELKSLNSTCESTGDDNEPNKTELEDRPASEVTEDEKKCQSSESPFPAKPLLRVRNLLGDRLSTPKADESDVVAMEEGKTDLEEKSENSSVMFTIENVRSLTEVSSEPSELKIDQVCSLQKQISHLGSQKTIIVRSCPTRQIPIRPKPSSSHSVDVGQINVVQSPVVRPVVVSPVSNNSPIRILSAALSGKQFSVKPVTVSGETVLNPNALPVIHQPVSPAVSPTVSNPTILPASCSSETASLSYKSPPLEASQETAQSVDVEVITSPNRSKSPAPSVTVHNALKNSSDAEETDEKDTIMTQRMNNNPSNRKKSVKDAKIYQEMLTKTKLCHLFKCMGIECSFTCNNQNVFTQHIGLHEAQMRLKKSKGIKSFYLRPFASKSRKAFYWQQCAYCCEVLNGSSFALSQHILEEHGHCMYQCAFCFYRAVSYSYVEIHQNLAHGQILKSTPRVMYKCKPLRTPPTEAAALEKHGRRQSVRPYHCDQCGRKFYITHEFMNHLASEHQSVTAYTCHICKNLCFKVNRLLNHYKMHSYSTYQCAYCLHGTETDKEMMFHLCNFHFSQPAVMYVRALAEGQKQLTNQLESLKVITCESDTLNLECVVEADPEEEDAGNALDSCLDITAIAAELGISTDSNSSATPLTPLMQELASIGDKNAKNLTVKCLLPNAEFSSENEGGNDSCSVLISSGLKASSDNNDESIPLGQLPLEIVSVHQSESSPPRNVESPDKNLKLNEIIANFQQKKAATLSSEEETPIQPQTVVCSATHKLPPVVLTRGHCPSLKSIVVRKKSVDQNQNTENPEGEKQKQDRDDSANATNSEESVKLASRKPLVETETSQPLITNIVSLAECEFERKEIPVEAAGTSIVISDICSLSEKEAKSNSEVQMKLKCPSTLEPPIIRVEDYLLDENTNPSRSSEEKSIKPKKTSEGAVKKSGGERCSSPDVIILEEEKTKDIVTVTIDSDDEKDEDAVNPKAPAIEDGKIRKEMEILRNQIATETGSLLLDETETIKPSRDLSLNIQTTNEKEISSSKTLMSPIEEAICSLNKKLQSETEEAQKKEETGKEKTSASPKKPVSSESNVSERPRTRFGSREKKKEETEKADGEENKKEDATNKKFKEELMGKELFICGNEKCNFAAESDSLLKDHLLVCDLSRDSSVLVCPHCSKQMKQFHPYLEHLKYHGEKKFHCGLCSFSSAVDTSTTKHVKLKHRCAFVKILPKEGQEGHFALYPKNYKVDKIDFEANGYSPGDEDKLPLQSVYQVNVKCAKCPYFTKVRSNMVRHLKIHVKSVETEGSVVVPSTAPTNPVPCLETKERMFDKMTNLAASSQLAQAREKTAIESLSPEEEAKLPQFVTEQMRYKCCLPDCNYITVDDGMLKHHIKALHDEINYYSCPHCKNSVHVDVRNVTLDKIGNHLKHHDAKLYKCAHCIYFHYQKSVVEKHTIEKHPDRRYFVHTVREPKPESAAEEESSSNDGGTRVWKCGLCNEFKTPSKPTLMDHLLKTHNTKSKYKCQFCSIKGNTYQAFLSHFSSKHPGEKVSYIRMYFSEKVTSSLESQSGNSSGADSSNEHFDTTPLWQRGAPRIRHIRGILIEEEEIKTKKSKRMSVEESESDTSDGVKVKENTFYCPLCTNKKKPFYTRNEDCFRTHLYQELNYQQFACILCGKMFVDKKDFDKHHARVHPDKSQALKQTKEDHEIKFWVDQVIAKRKKQMEERKRKLSDAESSGGSAPPKKKKEG